MGLRKRGNGGASGERGCLKGIVMDAEELTKKISGRVLREEAKKRGIRTSCVKKIDIARQLPPEVLERLASEAK